MVLTSLNLLVLRIAACLLVVLLMMIVISIRLFYMRSGNWRYQYPYTEFEVTLRMNGLLEQPKNSDFKDFVARLKSLISDLLPFSPMSFVSLSDFYSYKSASWDLLFVSDQSTTSICFTNNAAVKSLHEFELDVNRLMERDLMSDDQLRHLSELIIRSFLYPGSYNETIIEYLATADTSTTIQGIWSHRLLDLSQAIRENGFENPAHCFISHRAVTTMGDCNSLAEHIRQVERTSRYIILFTLLPPSSDLQYSLKEKIGRVFAYDVIMVDLNSLFELLVAKDHAKALRHLVLSQVDLTKISPFSLNGPTPENMFFGREQEIRLILENIHSKSYAIVGGRRIGKSSILIRLHKVILPAANIHSVYIDLSTISSYEEFLERKIAAVLPSLPGDFPATFKGLMSSSHSDTDTFCVLLDEADKIVDLDRKSDWRIFKALRAMANSGVIHVVLSGEHALREATRDSHSPLFNFADEIILHPLEIHSIEELVVRSMQQLDIELVEKAEIIETIFLFTSGHPNIVQRLCHRLIENMNQKGLRRITLSLVNEVVNSPLFLRDDFLGTVWESASPLEKIISLIMVESQKPLAAHKIQQLLEKKTRLSPKAREVDSSLQRLVDLRAILRHTIEGYEIANSAFPLAVSRVLTVADMVSVLVEECEEQS